MDIDSPQEQIDSFFLQMLPHDSIITFDAFTGRHGLTLNMIRLLASIRNKFPPARVNILSKLSKLINRRYLYFQS